MSRNHVSKIRIVLLVALVLLIGTTAVVVSRVGSREVVPSVSASGSEAQERGQTQHRQLVRVWVHGDAIQPPVIYAQPGRILFKADNETQSDISLVIERVNPGQANARVTAMGTQRKAKRVGQEMTLSPGEYAVYEESQPQYRATLIVQAKEERDH
ncbi:MAG: hypothetical protein AB1631_13865 [Acidobacteriota bacterium]